jgi:hypothetical protein
MTYNLDEDEKELLKTLTSYPRFYPAEFENNLNYLATLRIAAKHSSGWTKGAEWQQAINWLASLKPPRIRTCKNCGG